MNTTAPEKNRRVLVIDDNRTIHDDFRKILSPAPDATVALTATEAALFGGSAEVVEETRFEVDSAYQGQEGLVLVKKALGAGLPYALAFVDVRMPPGWDGMETTRKIWELDHNLQVVLCTAYSDYSWREMLEKLGHSDGLLILKKPFDAVEALQLARALTEKWWLHQLSQRKLEALESRVAERTHELQRSNTALRMEVVEKTRAEKELQSKTAFLEAQVSSSIDGILVVDPQGKMILQNSRFVDLLKIPREISDEKADEKRLRWVANVVKNAEEFLDRVAYLYSHPKEISRDEIELKDGTILDRYSSPVVGKDETYFGRMWTFRDITERKRAEELLRQHVKLQEQIAVIAATVPGMIFSFQLRPDGSTRMPYVSGALSDIFELQAMHIVEDATPIFSLIHASDIRHVQASIAESARTMTPWRDSFRFCNTRLGEIWVEGHSVPRREADGSILWHGFIQDITQRKRVEAQRERLAAIVEASPDFIGYADPETSQVQYINKHGRRMCGIGEDENVASLKISDLHPAWMNKLLAEVVLPTAVRDGLWEGEAAFLHRNGREIPVLMVLLSHKAADGVTDIIYTVSRDITERKRVEAQLVQAQKLETVGKLAGGIAHEFNNILTAILGHSELLLGDLPAGSPLTENAAEINKAAERAATLTRQLLAYSRKQFLQPESLNLNKVIAGMEGVFRHLMGGNVDVRILPAADLHLVRADAAQIEQVIMNIAINAHEAMPNAGRLTLETANLSFDQARVSRYPDLKPGDYVMLAITDTGKGMREEVKTRVFEPFFTTKGVGDGTGLGLSTCYGIIKQSGGHISVYSEPAHGATFKIYLPQSQLQPQQGASGSGTADLPRGTETILLVEDDPVLRELAEIMLERLGYRVVVAANGLEALNLAQQPGTGPIHVLFTDVVMPEMGGKELSDRMLALYPDIRLLFTSAYTENALLHQGVLGKGLALLQKPFSPFALAHKLREVLK